MAVRMVVVLLLILPAVGWADEHQDRLDRFELLNDCQHIDLLVTLQTSDSANIDLAEDDIVTAVRSRLKSARLYGETSTYGLLQVFVHVVGNGYTIDVDFHKPVVDVISAESMLANTWSVGSTGTHGGDGGYVLSFVSRHVDKFIDELLRVNAEACG